MTPLKSKCQYLWTLVLVLMPFCYRSADGFLWPMVREYRTLSMIPNFASPSAMIVGRGPYGFGYLTLRLRLSLPLEWGRKQRLRRQALELMTDPMARYHPMSRYMFQMIALRAIRRNTGYFNLMLDLNIPLTPLNYSPFGGLRPLMINLFVGANGKVVTVVRPIVFANPLVARKLVGIPILGMFGRLRAVFNIRFPLCRMMQSSINLLPLLPLLNAMMSSSPQRQPIVKNVQLGVFDNEQTLLNTLYTLNYPQQVPAVLDCSLDNRLRIFFKLNQPIGSSKQVCIVFTNANTQKQYKFTAVPDQTLYFRSDLNMYKLATIMSYTSGRYHLTLLLPGSMLPFTWHLGDTVLSFTEPVVGSLLPPDIDTLGNMFRTSLTEMPELSTVFHALNGLQSLDMPLTNLPPNLCTNAMAMVKPNIPESIYYATSIANALPNCKHTIAQNTMKQTLTNAIRPGATPQQIYYAVSALQNHNLPVDASLVQQVLSKATTVDMSPLNIGHAFKIASLVPSLIPLMMPLVPRLMAQARLVNGNSLEFDGGLPATALIASGLVSMLNKAPQQLPTQPGSATSPGAIMQNSVPLSPGGISPVDLTRLTNYLVLNRPNVPDARAAANLVSALTTLSMLKTKMPAALSLASPVAINRLQPNILVRVANVMGEPLPNSFNLVCDGIRVPGTGNIMLRNQPFVPFTSHKSGTVFQLPGFGKLNPSLGSYVMSLALSTPTNTILPLYKQFSFSVVNPMSIEAPQILVPNPLGGPALPESYLLGTPNVVPAPVPLDCNKPFTLSFNPNPGLLPQGFVPNKAFVSFISTLTTTNQFTFTGTVGPNGQFNFPIDMLPASVGLGSPNLLSGLYNIMAGFGNPLVPIQQNPNAWHLGSANLMFPEQPKAPLQSEIPLRILQNWPPLNPTDLSGLSSLFTNNLNKPDDLQNTFSSTLGLNFLGKPIPNQQQLCSQMKSHVQQTSLSSLYYTSSVTTLLQNCNLGLPQPQLLKLLQPVLKPGSTAQDLFYATNTMKNLGIQPQPNLLQSALLTAVNTASTTISMVHLLNAASFLPQPAQSIVSLMNNLLDQATTNGPYSCFIGGPDITGMVLQSVFNLAEQWNVKPILRPDVFNTLTNCLLSQRTPSNPLAAYHQLNALKTLSTNPYYIPVTTSLASPFMVNSAFPNFVICLSDFMGQNIPQSKNVVPRVDYITSVPSNDVVLTNRPMVPLPEQLGCFELPNLFNPQLGTGLYRVALSFQSPDPKFSGIRKELPMRVSNPMSIENPQLGMIMPGSTAPNFVNLAPAALMAAPMMLDIHKPIQMQFSRQNSVLLKGASPNKAFVSFVHSTTLRQITFTTNVGPNGLYKFDMDFPSSINNIPGLLPGPYRIMAGFGQPHLQNPNMWHLGDANLNIPQNLATRQHKLQQLQQRLPGNLVSQNPNSFAKFPHHFQSPLQQRIDIPSILYGTIGLQMLGSSIPNPTLGIPTATQKVLTSSISPGQPAINIFHAASTMLNLGIPINSPMLQAALLDAVKRDSSPSSLGYAFRTGALINEPCIPLLNLVPQVVDQAVEVDGNFLHYEGGLYETFNILSGIFGLAAAAQMSPDIPQPNIVKFANYFLSMQPNMHSPLDAFSVHSALNLLSNNLYLIPAIMSMASPYAVSSTQPNIVLRLTNPLGGALPGIPTVTLNSITHVPTNQVTMVNVQLNPFAPIQKRELQAAPDGSGTMLFQCPNFWSPGMQPGEYNLGVNLQYSDPRVIGLQRTVNVHLSEPLAINNIQLSFGPQLALLIPGPMTVPGVNSIKTQMPGANAGINTINPVASGFAPVNQMTAPTTNPVAPTYPSLTNGMMPGIYHPANQVSGLIPVPLQQSEPMLNLAYPSLMPTAPIVIDPRRTSQISFSRLPGFQSCLVNPQVAFTTLTNPINNKQMTFYSQATPQGLFNFNMNFPQASNDLSFLPGRYMMTAGLGTPGPTNPFLWHVGDADIAFPSQRGNEVNYPGISTLPQSFTNFDKPQFTAMQNTFTNGINPWSDLGSIFYSTAGLKLLGHNIPFMCCSILQTKITTIVPLTLDAVYYATSAAMQCGCNPLPIPNVQNFLKPFLQLGPTSTQLFYAISSMKNLGLPFDNNLLQNALMAAIDRDSGINSLGNAYRAAALLNAPQQQLLKTVDRALSQAVIPINNNLQYPDGLSPTANFLSGVLQLCQAANTGLSINPVNLVQFSNYLQSMPAAMLPPRVAYNVLHALNQLSNNKFNVPIVMGLASPMTLSSSLPNLSVHLSTPMGQLLPPGSNVVVETVVGPNGQRMLSNRPMVPMPGIPLTYQIPNFYQLIAQAGQYNVAVRVQSSDPKFCGLQRQIPVMLGNPFPFQNAQFSLSNPLLVNSTPSVIPLEMSPTMPSPIFLDVTKQILLSFGLVPNPQLPQVNTNNAFVALRYPATGQQMTFNSPLNNGLYNFNLNIPSEIVQIGNTFPGPYNLMVGFGQPSAQNQFMWHLPIMEKLPIENAIRKMQGSWTYLMEPDLLLFKNIFNTVLKRPNDLGQLSYAVGGLRILGTLLPSGSIPSTFENQKDLCNYVTQNTKMSDVESLFYGTSASQVLGCGFSPRRAISDLNAAIKVGTPSDMLFFAAAALQNLRQPINPNLQPAIEAAILNNVSPSSMAYALQAATLLSSPVPVLLNAIPALLSQAVQYDNILLGFENGLFVTSMILSGIFQLATKWKIAPLLLPDQVAMFGNYLVSHETSGSPMAAFGMLNALRVMSSNNYQVPITLSAASPFTPSLSQPNLLVRLTNLFGKPLSSSFNVYLERVVHQSTGAVVMEQNTQLLQNTADSSKSLFEMTSFFDVARAKGVYQLSFLIQAQEAKYVGVRREILFQVAAETAIEIAQLSFSNQQSSKAANSISLTYPQLIPSPIEINPLNTFSLKFQLSQTFFPNFSRMNQAFLILWHAKTMKEVIFSAMADAAMSYSVEVDLMKSKQTMNIVSGLYLIKVGLGDPSMQNPYIWHLADATVMFNEDIHRMATGSF